MSMPIVVSAASLLGVEPDQGINAHDSDTCLHGGLQLLDLAHAGLQHTCLQAVVHRAVR
jgi:hypothetical protein